MAGIGPLVVNQGGDLQTVKIEVALKAAARAYRYPEPCQSYPVMGRGSGPRRNIERPDRG